jgi:hypothetical protein
MSFTLPRDAGVVTDYVASEQDGEGETQHKSVEGNLTSTSDQNSPDVVRVASLPLPAVGPLYDPPPPPTTAALQPHSNPPPPPTTTGEEQRSSTLPDTVRELRAMEAMVKGKKKAIRALKKQQADPTDKKAEAKRLQEQLRAIKTEVKEERAKAKEGRGRRR